MRVRATWPMHNSTQMNDKTYSSASLTRKMLGIVRVSG